MGDWPISVIPNPIDVEQWQPHDKKQMRQELDIPIVLFGAMRGGKDPRKGFDLLKEA
ncbi:MAG TPA: hypothetical protein IGQ15_10675 [Thermosynechococcus sp. M98_K2018_005]|uniref:hypothetical protein n=1 Tax=Thermosynechococcus sp. M98_K2018_005 TaxID=2747811 RepID=UPI0019FD55A7|nr:hypothetical protein [Thermosynechococcus sp. M98_K2018_005]HIK36128.1 hypothetical protein [Thermosynechococcus sp. M98_K2018_005]